VKWARLVEAKLFHQGKLFHPGNLLHLGRWDLQMRKAHHFFETGLTRLTGLREKPQIDANGGRGSARADSLPQRGAEDTKGDDGHSHILKNVRMSDKGIEGCSRTRELLDGGRTSQRLIPTGATAPFFGRDDWLSRPPNVARLTQHMGRWIEFPFSSHRTDPRAAGPIRRYRAIFW
jgi:hypothetical protein